MFSQPNDQQNVSTTMTPTQPVNQPGTTSNVGGTSTFTQRPPKRQLTSQQTPTKNDEIAGQQQGASHGVYCTNQFDLNAGNRFVFGQ